MKHLFLGALAGALFCVPAWAQPQQNMGNNAFGAQGGAVFQLPSSVQNVVSIDALNSIIIAQDGEQPSETQYTTARIQHVYSGGIARLFGGTSVPTAQFATPGLLNGNNNRNGITNFGGNNFGGNSGFGGNNFNNGNGFGANGFGNNFGNAVLGGQGFNTNNRNVIANARLRAR